LGIGAFAALALRLVEAEEAGVRVWLGWLVCFGGRSRLGGWCFIVGDLSVGIGIQALSGNL
jgi:hypothetical protein